MDHYRILTRKESFYNSRNFHVNLVIDTEVGVSKTKLTTIHPGPIQNGTK